MTVQSRRVLVSGLVLALVLAGSLAPAAFAAKSEPAKDAKNTAPAAPGPDVVATIGDQKITEDDLISSLPADRQKAFQTANEKIQEIERQAVADAFAKKYVAEQAKAKGISEDAYYAQEIAAQRDTFGADYKTQISQIRQQIYDAKKAVLDDTIGKKLEEKAAKDKGVTVDALVKAEVEDKVAPVTPADIDQFYAQNQRQMGGQAKEAVSKQIEDAIKNQRMAQKRNEFRASLRAGVNIRTYLEVPRIAVSVDDDPVRGPKNAPVQIVEFSDFQCPFCSRVESTLKTIHETYGDKVSLVYRDFPLAFHQNAVKASEAANCAEKQGKYWEMHDALYANQGKLGVEDLKKQAQDLGLEPGAFNKCLDSGEMKAEVDKDTKEGGGYGVTGTPAFFINGRFISGAQPLENFKKIIDEELQMKGIPVPTAQATPPSNPGADVKR